VAAHRLVDLLHQARPMPRLVVLNSCSSGAAWVKDLFSGNAAALVRGGVSAVPAMQYKISHPAAVAFPAASTPQSPAAGASTTSSQAVG
jgi:hypothetical protein